MGEGEGPGGGAKAERGEGTWGRGRRAEREAGRGLGRGKREERAERGRGSRRKVSSSRVWAGQGAEHGGSLGVVQERRSMGGGLGEPEVKCGSRGCGQTPVGTSRWRMSGSGAAGVGGRMGDLRGIKERLGRNLE